MLLKLNQNCSASSKAPQRFLQCYKKKKRNSSLKTKLNFHQLLGSQCNVLVILLKQSVISAQVQARTVKLDFQVLNKDHPYFLLLSTSCCVFSLCENTVPSQVFMCVYLQKHSSRHWKNSLFLSRMHLEVRGFLFVFFLFLSLYTHDIWWTASVKECFSALRIKEAEQLSWVWIFLKTTPRRHMFYS